MVDEQTDPLPGVAEVDEHRALQELAPQCAPEAFDLPERLRPTRRGDDLLDAAFLQLAGEGALAAPGHVLRAVVGQEFRRRPIGVQRRPHHLDHQGRRLAGVQSVADNEAAVIVHEGDQVHPPILPLERDNKLMPQSAIRFWRLQTKSK